MTAILSIIVWAMIGAALMAIILARMDANVEAFEEQWIAVFCGILFWPLVVVALIVWFPAKWIYHAARVK